MMEEFRIRAARTFYRLKGRTVAVLSACSDADDASEWQDNITLFPEARIAGKPIIHHTISRVLATGLIDDIVVIARRSDWDLPLLRYCRENFKTVGYRLDSQDCLLEKIQEASDFMQAQTVVELFADQPFVDPNIMRQTIRAVNTKDKEVSQDSLGNFSFQYQKIIDGLPDGLQFRAIRKNYLDTIVTIGSLQVKNRSLKTIMSGKKSKTSPEGNDEFDFRINSMEKLCRANQLYECTFFKKRSWKKTYLSPADEFLNHSE